MRIIGGTLKRKKLCPLKGMRIRPTTDFLRESIFNILADRVVESVVLDLFAGTGSLGLEALSRGAATATFVDDDRQSVRLLGRNIRACRLDEQGFVFKKNICSGLHFLKTTGQTFDLVFIDPPYEKGLVEKTLRLLDGCQCIALHASVVVEHSFRECLPRQVANFEQGRQRRHGNTLVSFYESVL